MPSLYVLWVIANLCPSSSASYMCTVNVIMLYNFGFLVLLNFSHADNQIAFEFCTVIIHKQCPIHYVAVEMKFMFKANCIEGLFAKGAINFNVYLVNIILAY